MEIERAVGNIFEWRGAPQAADILSGCAAQCVEAVSEVDPLVRPFFLEAACTLIAQFGDPAEALAAALAYISGYSERPRSRSLLGSSEGYVTWEFHSGKEVPAPGYVFGALLRTFSQELTKDVRGMRLFADKKGACFDVPEKWAEEMRVAAGATVGFQWLRECSALPPLEEERQREGGLGGRGGGRDGGRGGGRDGGRGRGDGRGRGRDGGRGNGGRGDGGRGRGGDDSRFKRKFGDN